MSVKKMATDEVCVFSRGKTVERECFSSKIYLTRRKTFEDRKVCFNFLIFEKNVMKSTQNWLVDGGFVAAVQSIFTWCFVFEFAIVSCAMCEFL